MGHRLKKLLGLSFAILVAVISIANVAFAADKPTRDIDIYKLNNGTLSIPRTLCDVYGRDYILKIYPRYDGEKGYPTMRVSCDREDIATITDSSKPYDFRIRIHPLEEGTCNITVAFDEDSDYAESSTTFKLNVVDTVTPDPSLNHDAINVIAGETYYETLAISSGASDDSALFFTADVTAKSDNDAVATVEKDPNDYGSSAARFNVKGVGAGECDITFHREGNGPFNALDEVLHVRVTADKEERDLTKLYYEDGTPVENWSIDYLDVDPAEAGFVNRSSVNKKTMVCSTPVFRPAIWRAQSFFGDIAGLYVQQGNGAPEPLEDFSDFKLDPSGGRIIVDFMRTHLVFSENPSFELSQGKTSEIPAFTIAYETNYSKKSGTLNGYQWIGFDIPENEIPAGETYGVYSPLKQMVANSGGYGIGKKLELKEDVPVGMHIIFFVMNSTDHVLGQFTYTVVDDAKEPSTITFDPTTLTLVEGGSPVTVKIGGDGDGELTYTCEDNGVLEVTNVAGGLSVRSLKAGTCTITVTRAETDTYKAATATYTVTVTESQGATGGPVGGGGGGAVPGNPGTGNPGTDEPGKDEPGKDEPGKDEPGKDEPGKDEPTETKTVTVWRLCNDTTGEHLYTPDRYEHDVLVASGAWRSEGEGWKAPAEGKAVYRLYNPYLDDHLYTTDTNEVKVLTTEHGWQSDNNGKPVFYSGGSVDLYRLYNPNNGRHLITLDANEYGTLPSYGWTQEGAKLNAVS